MHDWNGDGVSAADEVLPGGRRGPRDRDQEFEEPDGGYQFDNWTADGFRGIDNNRDNRITADDGISTAKVSAAPITIAMA